MIRAVALSLAAVLLLAIVGCGGSSPTAETTGEATVTEPDTVAATTETPGDTGDPETATQAAETGSEVDEAALAEISGLVESWYAEVDPAVCNRMTDDLLAYGWAAKGDAGVKKCRTSLEAAEPVGDVRVGTPVISGAEAAVAVSYTLDGKEQRDGVTLVLVDGAWWLDTVARTG